MLEDKLNSLRANGAQKVGGKTCDGPPKINGWNLEMMVKPIGISKLPRGPHFQVNQPFVLGGV